MTMREIDKMNVKRGSQFLMGFASVTGLTEREAEKAWFEMARELGCTIGEAMEIEAKGFAAGEAWGRELACL